MQANTGSKKKGGAPARERAERKAAATVATQPEHDRTPPNRQDPLSEPTRHRRIWAAYLQAGYNRASWARALGAQYTSADRWDTGEVTMSLDTFMRACELLPYTPEQLHYGRQQPYNSSKREQRVDGVMFVEERQTGLISLPATVGGEDTELDDDGVRRLLAQLRASPEDRQALAALRTGPGRYDALTTSYVTEFIKQEAALRAKGAPAAQRIMAAHAAALRMQAQGRVLGAPPSER